MLHANFAEFGYIVHAGVEVEVEQDNIQDMIQGIGRLVPGMDSRTST